MSDWLCPYCFATYRGDHCPRCSLETYYFPVNYRRLREYGFSRDDKCFVCGKPSQGRHFLDSNSVPFPVCSDEHREYVRIRSEDIPLTQDNVLFVDLDQAGRIKEEAITTLECDENHPFVYRLMFEWESGDPEESVAYQVTCEECERSWSAYLHRDDPVYYEDVTDGE